MHCGDLETKKMLIIWLHLKIFVLCCFFTTPAGFPCVENKTDHADGLQKGIFNHRAFAGVPLYITLIV